MTDCFCSLASTNLLLSCLFSFGNVFEVNTLSRDVASGGLLLWATADTLRGYEVRELAAIERLSPIKKHKLITNHERCHPTFDFSLDSPRLQHSDTRLYL